jgi:hypothetical protein
MTSSDAPNPTAEQLLEQALRLPKEQRLRLADQLLHSVVGEESDTIEIDPELREDLVSRLKTESVRKSSS